MNKPEYVTNLEVSYGPPNQKGFGSAVFFERVESNAGMEQAARQKYQYFVGESWQRFGEEAWLSAWKQVYTRPAGIDHDIVTELRQIEDLDASQSTPMILDVIENAQAARQALSAAYDDLTVVDLVVYNLGDGAAMSGLLIAGRRSNGETTFLLFLMD